MDEEEINENAGERGFDESTASDEEHRFDEFEEMRGMLASILDAVANLRTDVANLAQQRAAALVESGEIVTDDGETAVVNIDAFEPLDEFDLEI